MAEVKETLDAELTRIQDVLERLGTISTGMLTDAKAVNLAGEETLTTLQTGARYISEKIEVLRRIPALEETEWRSYLE